MMQLIANPRGVAYVCERYLRRAGGSFPLSEGRLRGALAAGSVARLSLTRLRTQQHRHDDRMHARRGQGRADPWFKVSTVSGNTKTLQVTTCTSGLFLRVLGITEIATFHKL